MQDKNVIIAEAQRKAEKELKALWSWTSGYAWLSTVIMVVICLFVLRSYPKFPFPTPIALFCMPIIAYVGVIVYRWGDYVRAQVPIVFLKKEPRIASDYANRAGTLYGLKFYEAAVDDYRTALAMPPDDSFDVDSTWINLASVIQKLDRDDEALGNIDKAEKDRRKVQTFTEPQS